MATHNTQAMAIDSTKTVMADNIKAVPAENTKKVFCTYCGQGFTRDEHLERHILTHTHVKPHKCHICHMSFSRRDLLGRHGHVHGRNKDGEEGGLEQGLVPKSAGRTPIACTNCAKTKTRCDKKFPCTRCEQRNLECTPRPSRRQSKQVQRNLNGSLGETQNTQETLHHSDSTPPSYEAQSNRQSPFQQPLHSSSAESSKSHSRNTSVSQPTEFNTEPNFGSSDIRLLPDASSFFAQPSTHSLSQAPALQSPLSAPMHEMSGFISFTPVSGFDEFARTASEQSEFESPQLFVDPWNSTPVTSDFDVSQIDPGLMMPMNMNSNSSMDLNMDHSMAGIFDAMPGLSSPHLYGPMRAAIHPQVLEDPTPNAQVENSGSMYYPPNGQSSITDHGLTDLCAVTNAQNEWTAPHFAPSITPDRCSRTATLSAGYQEPAAISHENWSNTASPSWDGTEIYQENQISEAPLQGVTRDRLLAITQQYLHQALHIHKDRSSSSNSDSSPDSAASRSNLNLQDATRDRLLDVTQSFLYQAFDIQQDGNLASSNDNDAILAALQSRVPLQEHTRDRLFAATQSYLHQAVDIHKDLDYFSSQGTVPGSGRVVFQRGNVSHERR